MIVSSMDHHPVQFVVIQDPVVDSFCCGALVIDLLKGFCPAGDICVETYIPFRFCSYNAAIL